MATVGLSRRPVLVSKICGTCSGLCVLLIPELRQQHSPLSDQLSRAFLHDHLSEATRCAWAPRRKTSF